MHHQMLPTICHIKFSHVKNPPPPRYGVFPDNFGHSCVSCYLDPVCVLSSARDHARETLRAHAAQDRLVSRLFQLSTVKFHINTPRTLGTGTAVVDRRCEWDRGTKAPPQQRRRRSLASREPKRVFLGRHMASVEPETPNA